MYIGNIYPHISISELIISLTSYQMYQDDSILVYEKTIHSRLSYFKAERMHARVSKLFQEWFNNSQGIGIKLPRLWYNMKTNSKTLHHIFIYIQSSQTTTHRRSLSVPWGGPLLVHFDSDACWPWTSDLGRAEGLLGHASAQHWYNFDSSSYNFREINVDKKKSSFCHFLRFDCLPSI